MVVTLCAKRKTVFLDLEDRTISCKSQLTLSSCMARGNFLSLRFFIFEGEVGRESPGPCWTWLSDDFINVFRAGGSQTVIDYFNIVFEKNRTMISVVVSPFKQGFTSPSDHLLQGVHWDSRNVIHTPDILMVTSGPQPPAMFTSGSSPLFHQSQDQGAFSLNST